MEYSIIQIALVFIWTFICAIDQFDFLESLYQPIVSGLVIGLILGDPNTGLVVGGTYQLLTIGNMPIGGAQPPNAVIGGIMAAVLAIALKTTIDYNTAAALAIPFALLGQIGVTIVFTLMSPLMSAADRMAHNADVKGIVHLNYFAMGLLGLIFAVVVTLFFIAGATIGQTVAAAIPQWLQDGLSAAGGMMKFVGFAILLKVMMSRDMWGFFFMGFALAIITVANESLATPALLILSLIGFGIAFWDYQQRTELAGSIADGGDMEDGI
ncbi:phosphotransferase system PTS sorbose-specific IIC subunit [Coriobacterium glomerans PW2]|uniref:Phosphotransferase system PTS sorbose-specific IIC subunit n=1 Tax=Coriobacterium glomerans (strain ATCC 49209 / DSM 20642 / JCM 10262 / PW2) TaxID=700015 RepID=F2NAJ7_CORGP|nr:PTS sugar transporter subunit IIC [Coriobacterium glomerans]AEB06524.1 phosphotransferase system PTS sorbose-specific IIC subunit [Coriobacterium glomerans PW2]